MAHNGYNSGRHGEHNDVHDGGHNGAHTGGFIGGLSGAFTGGHYNNNGQFEGEWQMHINFTLSIKKSSLTDTP